MKLVATLTKRYGAREVLSAATLELAPNTVHAIVGENGAGKSTLVKLLAGVVGGGVGKLEIDDVAKDLGAWDRKAARAAGIGIVQQHGASAGALSVVENAMLGVEPVAHGMLDLVPSAAALAKLGEELGLPIDPVARVDELGLGAAQRAEIVAALHHGADLLILDEPTAVLTPVEADALLGRLRKLAAGGRTIVFVTHKLDEVRAVADHVTVLRDGKTVATFDAKAAELDVKAIAKAMVGDELPTLPPPPRLGAPNDALRIELGKIKLQVGEREIVGVAGVDGNGQRELARAIVGLDRAGKITIGGRVMSRAPTAQRLAAGLGFVPEDRHHGGLVLDATVAENLALGRADITGRFRIDRERVAKHAAVQIAELDIRPANPDALARDLSGGNQQKLVIGRELSRPGLRAVVAAQPTRGVDLGAVAKIHDRLRAVAAAGAGVLVISADLDELLALCHRIVVVLRGTLVGERSDLRSPDVRAELGALMTGAA